VTKQAFLEISNVGGGGNRAIIDAKADFDKGRNDWRAFDEQGFEAFDSSGNRALLRVFAQRLGVPMENPDADQAVERIASWFEGVHIAGMQGAYGFRIAAAVRRRDWLEDKPLDVDTPTREQKLTNALRDALNLAARVLEQADHDGEMDVRFIEEKTRELGELQKVLEEQ
jgi:hypothetical protein